MNQYVPFRANMGQHCTLSAVQRKTGFLEQSWWPEFDRTPKNCDKVYSLNLIDEFTSLFSPRWLLQVCLGKAFPMPLWTWVFSVVVQQDSPKASPRAIFKWNRTTEAFVPMNTMNERWRKLNANMNQYVPFRANMGQHCSLSAVQRKTGFLEQSWWPEFDMFGSMPWCSLADAKELW